MKSPKYEDHNIFNNSKSNTDSSNRELLSQSSSLVRMRDKNEMFSKMMEMGKYNSDMLKGVFSDLFKTLINV